MLRAIVVDDEPLALNRVVELIRQDQRVSVIGSFTEISLVCKFIKQNQADIIFLKIEMPEISGIAFTERLRKCDPSIIVILMTAYSKYALDAFRVQADGYLMKPLEQKQISEAVNGILNRSARRIKFKERNAQKLCIRCFKEFECYSSEDRDDKIDWRTSKSEELFAYLLFHEGRSVSKEKIIEDLWPDMNETKANNNFYVTTTYIRNGLSKKGFDNNIIVSVRGSYYIEKEQIECDIFRFNEIIRLLEAGEVELELLEEASSLYRGPFLANLNCEWSTVATLWYENNFKKLQLRLKEAYMHRGETGKAMEALMRIIEYDPFAEDAFEQLIELKLQSGSAIEARMIYDAYKEMLLREMSVLPSHKLMNLMSDVPRKARR